MALSKHLVKVGSGEEGKGMIKFAKSNFYPNLYMRKEGTVWLIADFKNVLRTHSFRG